MKRFCSVTAMFLAVILLFSVFAGCGTDAPDESRPQEAGTTAAPARTSAEPAATTVGPEYTASPVNPPETPEEASFSVWKSAQSESFLSGREEDAPLYAARAEGFLASSGIALKETVTEDLRNAVTNGVLSGDVPDILLLNVRTEGTPLFCAGVLQDLSAAGIGLSAESDCTVLTLTQDLMYNGRLFLVPYRGLLSDVSASFAVSVRNRSDAYLKLNKAFLQGEYTLDTVLSYLREWEELDPETMADEWSDVSSEEYLTFENPAIGGGSKALEALFFGAGGRVMWPGKTPEIRVYSLPFSDAFTAASAFAPHLSDREETIGISVLSERNTQERTLLPLPKISSSAVYMTPVEAENLTVVAAAGGLVYGQRAAEMLQLLSDLSAELRTAAVLSEDLPAQTAEILFSTQHVDLAKIYTWGDLYDMVFSYLGSAGYSALANNAELDRRIKVADNAAEIVRSRYP